MQEGRGVVVSMKRMSHCLLIVVITTLAFLASLSSAHAETTIYHGKLGDSITPLQPLRSIFLSDATVETRKALPEPVSETATVQEGVYHFFAGENVRIVLIQPVDAAPYIYIDLNRDGKIDKDERRQLVPEKSDGTVPTIHKNRFQEVLVSLPIELGKYHSYPLRVLVQHVEGTESVDGRDYKLTVSWNAEVRGTIQIEGSSVLVAYTFSAKKTLNPLRGRLSADVNMNGERMGLRWYFAQGSLTLLLPMSISMTAVLQQNLVLLPTISKSRCLLVILSRILNLQTQQENGITCLSSKGIMYSLTFGERGASLAAPKLHC